MGFGAKARTKLIFFSSKGSGWPILGVTVAQLPKNFADEFANEFSLILDNHTPLPQVGQAPKFLNTCTSKGPVWPVLAIIVAQLTN